MNRTLCAGVAAAWVLGAVAAWAAGAACPSVEPPDPGEGNMETARVVSTNPGEVIPGPGGVPAEAATFALG